MQSKAKVMYSLEKCTQHLHLTIKALPRHKNPKAHFVKRMKNKNSNVCSVYKWVSPRISTTRTMSMIASKNGLPPSG